MWLAQAWLIITEIICDTEAHVDLLTSSSCSTSWYQGYIMCDKNVILSGNVSFYHRDRSLRLARLRLIDEIQDYMAYPKSRRIYKDQGCVGVRCVGVGGVRGY